MKRTCSIKDCEAPHKGHGLCHKHLARFRRNGDPLVDRRRHHKSSLCSIEGCGKLARTRGWCPMHYTRVLKHGDPLTRLPMGPEPGTQRQPVEPRFWAKVNKTESCWLWMSGTAGEGYGVFHLEHGRQVYAHRFAYELLVGPIPEGLEIDHLCRVRLCVRPDHLEAVTPQENQRRANAKTHCPRGHDREGRPHCRICKRDAARARRVKARAVDGIPNPLAAPT